jgi:uracil-DNA glycosylase family 4
LFDEHKGFSRLEGDGSSGLMVIAESLGRQEERESLPLRPTAPSGGIFQRAVDTSGLSRPSMVLTNTIRCKSEAPYPPEAIEHCRQYTDAAIEQQQPRFILALGDVPFQALKTVDGGLMELRGYVLPSRYGIPMIATAHPSRIARGDSYLFPVLRHDLRIAQRYALHGIPQPLPTTYNLTPTIDDVLAYIDCLEHDPSLYVSYDCETGEIIGRKGPKDWRQKELIQIQFSSAIGEAIVLPWEGEYRSLAKRIMAAGHTKLGWHSRLSDDLLLRANDFTIGGEAFDCMTMFSHLQPSFASGKDAKESDDKGVPSRLLNLQSAISFYYPYEQLYKSTMRRGIKGEVSDDLWDDVRLGGAKDVDFTLRIGLKLIDTLKHQGLWTGWYRYKHLLGQVLTTISDRGLPIDRSEQQELLTEIESQTAALEHELQTMVPVEIRPVKSYKGFPKDLREAVKAAGRWVKCCKPIEFPDLAETLGYEVNGCLIKRLPFNADSPKQVLRYIQYCTAQEAEAFDDPRNRHWFIPIDVDSGKPTTNKAGIESLIAATDDPTLKQIRKCKKIGDLKSYCTGDWIPGDDGRVHADFRVGATATGQTTAVDPPIQTFPKHADPADEWLVPIVKRIKMVIKAEPGHRMVEVDMTGFHAKVQSHLAGDELYSRLADFDLHSYNVAHYLQLPDAHGLQLLDDDALRKRLREIKEAHSYERNFILKRIAFLRQFAGGAQKAASIMKIPVIEVMEIFNMMDSLFKPVFKDFPASIEKLLHKSPRIISPFGCQRWFWDGDIQQAVAFLPANCAHCTIQDALIRLYDKGALDRYGAFNFVHDSLWFHCREELVDECIAEVKSEFEKPSEVLISEKMGPFQCRASASVGESMGEMVDV